VMDSESIESHFAVPDRILSSWQNIVDTLAQVMEVPSALILRLVSPDVEVLCAANSDNNPWKAGDKSALAGLYTEEVISTGRRLVVADARKDPAWTGAPELEQGMVAYMGLPVCRPDGKVFGAICVLDTKENHFEPRHEKMMLAFKELMEAHLAGLHGKLEDLSHLESVLDNLTEGVIAHDVDRTIRFFNRAAEEITGYSRKDVLGRDCHSVFGGPFCGNRCSFKNNAPPSLDDIYYPLNILTRKGDPRRVEMAVSGRKDAAGQLTGIIASFRDVTDLIGLKIQMGDLKGFAGIVGKDPSMLRVYRQIRELGTNDYPVHITGETGTGKELVAAAIHNESRRGGGPFVPVNCAALPEGVLESELFGHVKGAFTGAVRDKKGRFGLADHGTLFLDEVADLPPSFQAKLLRVIQEGVFERVGDEKTTAVDVRIISATNKDLKREVEKGRFRQDLYYRINVVPIHMPPLRKRPRDIPLLIEHFLDRVRQEGQTPPGVSKETIQAMMDYNWPGNVRELQSALRFAMVKSQGRVVRPEHLPMELHRWRKERSARGPSRKLEEETVRIALAQAGGSKTKAARFLGVGRATLYRFLADFPDVS
jgi:PAS domain S-box-containing protein